MSGENNSRARMFGGYCEHIETLTFDGNLLSLKASPEQFSVKEVAHRALVAGDGLDIHESTG
jgi:hypothetical protein